MMVRNDPLIYSQNNNIPIVVGTHQGHTSPWPDVFYSAAKITVFYKNEQILQSRSVHLFLPKLTEQNGTVNFPKKNKFKKTGTDHVT
ncbi:hypothetical protein BpHYR1_040699 [Brachionus plicatilis]|uniref:Uncharacterized protein n=1 Tax=Brachionus plicatilis TaxID=10195 RepID=A0A3M7QCJ2_BRAPC|nr:hypothetical protein BpHYR1_040699 [Brachionus plicatilis]